MVSLYKLGISTFVLSRAENWICMGDGTIKDSKASTLGAELKKLSKRKA